MYLDLEASIERPSRNSSGQRLVDLDYVPHSKVDRVLSRLKASVAPAAGLRLGIRRQIEQETVTLELTMRNPSLMELAPLSSTYSVVAFPFLPFTYSTSNRGDQCLSKSTTPLNITLPDLIHRLEHHRLPIISVTDLSKEKADELWDEVKRLETYTNMGECMEEGQGRREVGLKRAWEAGLLESGMLVRWRVVVVIGGGDGSN